MFQNRSKVLERPKVLEQCVLTCTHVITHKQLSRKFFRSFVKMADLKSRKRLILLAAIGAMVASRKKATDETEASEAVLAERYIQGQKTPQRVLHIIPTAARNGQRIPLSVRPNVKGIIDFQLRDYIKYLNADANYCKTKITNTNKKDAKKKLNISMIYMVL